MSQEPISVNPALTALLTAAFALAHGDDEAAARGADNARRYLSAAPVFAFDPTESRAASEKGSDQYVTDGTYCTCKASKGLCKHRIAHRVALAALALTDPAALTRGIVEQAVAPVEGEPVAAPTITPVITRIAIELLDLTDNQTYLDLVMGMPVAPGLPRSTVHLSDADREIDELYPR